LEAEDNVGEASEASSGVEEAHESAKHRHHLLEDHGSLSPLRAATRPSRAGVRVRVLSYSS
jgi:hypothetical protein